MTLGQVLGNQAAETSRMNNELSVGDIGDITTLDFQTDELEIWNSRIKSTYQNEGPVFVVGHDEYSLIGAVGSEIEGLVAHFTLNDHLRDSSGSYIQAVWSGSENYADGHQFNKSAVFDDIENTSIEIQKSFIIGSDQDFTVTCWAKSNDISDTSQTLVSNIQGGFNNGWGLFYNASGAGFWLEGTDGNLYRARDNVTRDTDWHFYIGEYDSNNKEINFYLDDGLVFGPTSTGSFLGTTTTTNTIIGKYVPNTAYNMDGNISDVRIYYNKLTPAEKSRLYNEGLGIIDNCIDDTGSRPIGPNYNSRYIRTVQNSHNLFIEQFNDSNFIDSSSTGSLYDDHYRIDEDEYLQTDIISKEDLIHQSAKVIINSEYITTGSDASNDLSIYAIINNDTHLLTHDTTTIINNTDDSEGLKIKIINANSDTIKIDEILVKYDGIENIYNDYGTNSFPMVFPIVFEHS